MQKFINDGERQNIITEIQRFLGRAAHAGGVFVLCGPRGSGKTRVVDEALVVSNRPKKNHKVKKHLNKIRIVTLNYYYHTLALFSVMGRRSPYREKLSILRYPRKVKRHIIKIDLRFPLNRHPENPNIHICGSLLDSLIFELTSQLDPRANRRLYGRTLRYQLGFWRYHFSINGLNLYCTDNKIIRRFLLIAPLLLLYCFYWVLFNNLSGLKLFNLELQALTASVISFLSLWAFFRHLDWVGFRRFSERLYSIIHADQMKQSSSPSPQDYIQAIFKSDTIKKRFLAILAAISGGSGLFAISCLTSYNYGNIPILSTNNVLAPTITLIILALSFGLFMYLRRFSLHGIESIYSGNNKEWKITLLRRYLFLLHRLGIEPVIVLDELDKLKENIKIKVKPARELPLPEIENEKPATKTPNVLHYSKVNGLSLLFNELIPLKQNLGANFLWILIGDAGLMERIIRADEAYPPGEEATVIQKYISLGIVKRSQVQAYLQEFDTSNNTRQHGDFYWIVSRGLYADLYSQDKTIKIEDEALKKAEELAKICETFDDTDIINALFSDIAHMSTIADVRRRHRNWLLMGVLDGARAELLGIGNKKIQEPPPKSLETDNQALLYDANLLISMGRNLFFTSYQREQQSKRST